ncbi:unnamed protein product [Rhizoctonia solani]|uniref:Uncharacterized protein n=1 Tax=Rhizoctonia solani TaxID=456999 RepID=A0A8H2WLW6_9AGAM|nr:unnamed protein product [Rhizoctonia solani]
MSNRCPHGMRLVRSERECGTHSLSLLLVLLCDSLIARCRTRTLRGAHQLFTSPSTNFSTTLCSLCHAHHQELGPTSEHPSPTKAQSRQLGRRARKSIVDAIVEQGIDMIRYLEAPCDPRERKCVAEVMR